MYFINHRYDGAALWNLRRAPLVHEVTLVLNFVSFYFLYPSTFNLLEVSMLAGLRVGILVLLSSLYAPAISRFVLLAPMCC